MPLLDHSDPPPTAMSSDQLTSREQHDCSGHRYLSDRLDHYLDHRLDHNLDHRQGHHLDHRVYHYLDHRLEYHLDHHLDHHLNSMDYVSAERLSLPLNGHQSDSNSSQNNHSSHNSSQNNHSSRNS